MAISFVGVTSVASAASVTVTTISTAIPTGVLAGDLLILTMASGADVGTVTDPTGWTLLRTSVDPGTPPAEARLTLWTRTATGSDAAPTVNMTVSSRMVLICAAYRGVNTATPFLTENAVAEAGGATTTVHSAPALTNTNAAAWGVYALSSRQVATPYTATPGTGLTERVDKEVGNAGSTNVLGYWADSNGTVGTGSVTYSATGSAGSQIADMWAGFLSPAVADTTAPTVPSSVTATANSATSVTVSWTASTDAVGVASYRIRRGGVDLTGATAVSGTSFTDTSVAASTAYSYTVSAVDAAGNRSAESTAATVTTPAPADAVAPSVPGNVNVTVNAYNSISIAWDASTDNVGVTSYRVRRGGVDVTGATALSTTSFTDNTVVGSTAYSYTVSAVDAAGNRSAESTSASATTPAAPVIAGAITHISSSAGYSPAGVSSPGFTPSAPPGLLVGDFILAKVSTGATTNNVATPTGWTLVSGPIPDAQSGDGNHYVFSRVVDGTANDTPAWIPNAAATLAVGYVALRGVAASPINAVATASGVGSPTTAPALTTTVPNCLVVSFIGDRKANPDTPPRYTPVDTTNWTDEDYGVGQATPSLSVHDALHVQATAGAVTGQTWTQSSSTNGWVVISVAIAPMTTATDTTPPTVPTNVVAVANSQTQVTLSWTASTDAVGVAGYTVKRGGTTLATNVSASPYVDSTVSASTSYSYTVSAADNAGNQSADSSPATVTTPDVFVGAQVTGRWVGAATSSSVTVTARTAAGVTAGRLKVATNSALSAGVVFGPSGTFDADHIAKLTVSGLTANTTYFYGVELDGVVDTSHVGTFKTFPSGPASFSFAFGSCTHMPSGATGWSVDSATFARIKARNPALFLHLGDFRYANPTTGQGTQVFKDMFNEAMSTVNGEAALYASTPTAYVWSDHDATGSNGDSTSGALPFAQSVYRQFIPSYALPAADNKGIYHTFVVGRVRFVMTDNRSYKTPDSATDNASKTMLGAVQKQWLKDTISAANEPLIVWGCENLWHWPAEVGGDSWGGFTTERTELANYIKGTGKNVIVVSGDTHMMAADDGTNSPGGLPQMVGAPIENVTVSSGGTGGPWSVGTYTLGSGFRHYYGWVDVVDTGSSISFTYSGYDDGDVARLIMSKTYDSLVVRAKIDTLTEDFTAKDTGKWAWNPSGNITVVGGQAVSTTTSVYDGEIGSVDHYDLTGSSVLVQLAQAANTSPDTTTETYIEVHDDSGNVAGFDIYQGHLWCHYRLSNVETIVQQPDYSPTSHAYLRLRESAGTLYWDASADGTTWTILASAPNPAMTLSSVRLWLGSGFWGSDPLPGKAIFDNVNFLPGTVVDRAKTGAVALARAYVGASAISKMYVGSTQVWSPGTAAPPPVIPPAPPPPPIPDPPPPTPDPTPPPPPTGDPVTTTVTDTV